jgi:hypothetical protein
MAASRILNPVLTTSAYEHAAVVPDYLSNECAVGHILGPFQQPPIPSLVVSRFGVITKRGQPKKWRFIVDLSSPENHSVNEGIDPQNCTLS